VGTGGHKQEDCNFDGKQDRATDADALPTQQSAREAHPVTALALPQLLRYSAAEIWFEPSSIRGKHDLERVIARSCETDAAR
jgi:hypothetical protein